jgi:hypothetical protein
LFQVVAQAQIRELKLGLVEIGERLAEVHQHQVAFVTQHGEKGGLACRVLLHGGED